VQCKQTTHEVSHTILFSYHVIPYFPIRRPFFNYRQDRRSSFPETLEEKEKEYSIRSKVIEEMSAQYSFAPYQEPPEDIPAHEREQAAFTSASHYSSQDAPPQGGQADAFLGNPVNGGDDRINQYETSLPLRLVTSVECVDS
jgi:hypothetical protein